MIFLPSTTGTSSDISVVAQFVPACCFQVNDISFGTTYLVEYMLFQPRLSLQVHSACTDGPVEYSI